MTASTPARGYSWPPFERGHELSTVHGAKSPGKVRPIAAEIRAELITVAPWAAQPAFAASLEALAWVEAQCVLLRRYIDEHGLLDDAGNPRPALATSAELERRAARLRAEFGMSPTTWASLHRSLAPDPDGGTSGVEALRAIGAQILEGSARPVDDDGVGS